MVRQSKKKRSAAAVGKSKCYLASFPNGIYGTNPVDNTGEFGYEKGVEFKDMILKPDNYCWSLSATKANIGGGNVIKIEAKPDNRYDFPHKKITLDVTLFHKDIEVVSKEFLFSNPFDTQNFVLNVDQQKHLLDSDDMKIEVAIFLYPDGYVSDRYGTESTGDEVERAHDAVLVVGDKKLYVIKKYLSTWSHFFNTMFHKVKKGQKVFHIKEVDPTDLELLLYVINPDRCYGILDNNVISLLKLAAKLEIPSVMSMCGEYLNNFENVPSLKLIDRLKVADEYNLISLQAEILRNLHGCPMTEYEEFMANNKERIKELSVQTLENLYKLRS